jgi:hypothetical protein
MLRGSCERIRMKYEALAPVMDAWMTRLWPLQRHKRWERAGASVGIDTAQFAVSSITTSGERRWISRVYPDSMRIMSNASKVGCGGSNCRFCRRYFARRDRLSLSTWHEQVKSLPVWQRRYRLSVMASTAAGTAPSHPACAGGVVHLLREPRRSARPHLNGR